MNLVNQDSASATPELLDLANNSLPSPYNDPSTMLDSLNDTFFSSHPNNASTLFAFARTRQFLDPSSKSSSEDTVLQVFDSCQDITLEELQAGITVLKDLHSSDTILQTFIRKAKETWPEATVLDREAAT